MPPAARRPSYLGYFLFLFLFFGIFCSFNRARCQLLLGLHLCCSPSLWRRLFMELVREDWV